VEFDDDSQSLVLTDGTHSMPLWLLPSVAAPVGSSIIVTHGEILLGAADDSATCAVLHAMQLKFRAPRPRSIEKIWIMVRFITPGVLYAPVPNSWLDCVVVRAAAAVVPETSVLPVVGDAVMVWLSKDAKELLSYARVGSVFALQPSECEHIPAVVPTTHKTFKLELHSPLLLQLQGWIPICLSAFAVSWDDLKMVSARQKNSIDESDDIVPPISLGSLQTACRLPNPFIRTFLSVQNLPTDYNLVSSMCVVSTSYQNWEEHEQVLVCRDLSEDELKSVQHMLLEYSLDSIASPSSAQCTTVTIKLDRLAVPHLVTPGCVLMLHRFWHRRSQRGVFIKCSPVSHLELLLPAGWLPQSEAPKQHVAAADSIAQAHQRHADSQLMPVHMESQAAPISDGDINRWRRVEALGSVDRSSCSWQFLVPSEQPVHLMDIRRNPSVVTDVVANIVAIKSVSVGFQCSVCSCVAVAGHAYLPNDKVHTETTAQRRRANQDSLVKTREMRCSRCRRSRMAVFTAKCVVQLDDGTDSAVAHAASLALVQAVLRLSPVALERMADLVSREGCLQLLYGSRRWERQQDGKRVSAASKALADMCVLHAVMYFAAVCGVCDSRLQLPDEKSLPACVHNCLCPPVSLRVIDAIPP
jgi:hypothetical protein